MQLTGLVDLLDHAVERDSIQLPWRGETYVIPAPGTERRLRCAALLAAYRLPEGERAAAIKQVAGDESAEDIILGAEMAQRMHADGIPERALGYLTTIALFAWVQGEEKAQAYVNALQAGDVGPKAKASSKRSRTGTSTDAAPTTRTRASTSGTTSRRNGSRKRKGGRGGRSTGGTS
ncbi:hypothetical protein GCM10027059_26520 [Myceligenerans halotolerans]